MYSTFRRNEHAITVSNESITSEQTYTENKGARSNSNIKNINEHRSNAITRAVNKAEAAIVSITVTELQRGYTRDFDSFSFDFLNAPYKEKYRAWVQVL